MKTNLGRMAVLVVAAVTMAAPAFAGQTPAERERALRQSAETGSLSPGDAKQMKSEGGARTEVPTVEIGGMLYRIGIDTP